MPEDTHFLLRCRVSSDLDLLEAVNMAFPWVPGRESIRPSEATKALKRTAMEATNGRFDVNRWSIEFFGAAWDVVLSSRQDPCKEELDARIRLYHFAPNLFPYAVPEGTKHYILWLPSTVAVDEDTVNRFLTEAVFKEGGEDFVWYENPKPTILEIWHVQVFWH